VTTLTAPWCTSESDRT